MRLKTVSAAAALLFAASTSFAAAGDVVFTSDFGASIGSSGSFTSTFTFADLSSGAYEWETAAAGTGKLALTSVTFNGITVAPTGPKSAYDVGSFAGGPVEVVVKGTSTGKGSFGGSVTITSAVPEPETYALLLAGLTGVGFVARRRKSA